MILSMIIFILYSNRVLLEKMTGIDLRFEFWLILFLGFIACNVFPSFKSFPTFRISQLQRGVVLLIEFLITFIADVALLTAYIIISGQNNVELGTLLMIKHILVAFFAGVVIFWNGMIRVYLTSIQIGVKWRVIGALVGMIPIAHLIVLGIIIHKARRECVVETARCDLNESRAESAICATKYPILMVHGIFFRDRKVFNYWGRIPGDLKKNGAVIYYGDQESAMTVHNCGRQLAKKIKQITDETGCGKVNIIAHSKGGLDSRAAITLYGAEPYVASLTTVNTPHHGCLFADYLLSKAPEKLKHTVATGYNGTLKHLGDKNPDFIAAVTDLTNEECERFNKLCPDSDKVIYQSMGSKALSVTGGRFPLNLSYAFVKHFDGPNDGLVSVESMKWGENFTLYVPEGTRGITHGDVIDLNRENVKGYDVREVYVQLVAKLKERGL